MGEVRHVRRCTACGQFPPLSRGQIDDLVTGMRDTNGYGWSAIAEKFNQLRLPTLSGGKTWYPSTIQAIYRKATGADNG